MNEDSISRSVLTLKKVNGEFVEFILHYDDEYVAVYRVTEKGAAMKLKGDNIDILLEDYKIMRG